MTAPSVYLRQVFGASSSRSLRGRLARWAATVLGVSLVGSSAVRVLIERRHILEGERLGAASFLERVVAAPDAFRDLAQARHEIETVNRLVRPWSARVDVVTRGAPTPPGTALLVSRPIQFPEGAFELRYRVSDAYVSAAVQRAVIFHVVHAVLTFALMMAGVEWILRRRLREPLHKLAHQVDRMREGGGWQPVLPATDAECSEIAAAVSGLGPGLVGQVEMWIEGERRAAIAAVLGRLRRGLDCRCDDGREREAVHVSVSQGTTCQAEAVNRLIDSVEKELLIREPVPSVDEAYP